MGGRQVQLVAGHDYGNLLVVGPLFPDFLEALFDAVEGWRRRHCVHQQEGVSRCDAEASHGGKLHVASGVQDVHLYKKNEIQF